MQNFQNHIGIVWDILVIDLLIHMCRRAVAVMQIVSNDKMENSPYYRVPSCSTRIIRPVWSLYPCPIWGDCMPRSSSTLRPPVLKPLQAGCCSGWVPVVSTSTNAFSTSTIPLMPFPLIKSRKQLVISTTHSFHKSY